MQRINVNVEQLKTNTNEVRIKLVSWKNKKRIEESITMKNNQYISDFIYHVYNLKSELKGKFILKTAELRIEGILKQGEFRIGGKLIPINKKISDIWDSKQSFVPIIKVITPDKYPANPAKNRYYNENPLYSVEFLIKFGKEEPINLHSSCIFNNLRLGRGINHPANLFLMKTPYGNLLNNIYDAKSKFLGATEVIDDPVDKIKISIQINDKTFAIPKQAENASALYRLIKSFGGKLPESRQLELYTIDMIEQESIPKMLKRVFWT